MYRVVQPSLQSNFGAFPSAQKDPFSRSQSVSAPAAALSAADPPLSVDGSFLDTSQKGGPAAHGRLCLAPPPGPPCRFISPCHGQRPSAYARRGVCP